MDLSEKTDNLKELNNKVLSQAQEINLRDKIGYIKLPI